MNDWVRASSFLYISWGHCTVWLVYGIVEYLIQFFSPKLNLGGKNGVIKSIVKYGRYLKVDMWVNKINYVWNPQYTNS
mgnify:CR=1 FL=1